MLAHDESLGELLVCASRGDEEAFARLYDQTNSRSYGLAISILGDPQAAEEATLDAYEQVWRQAARYDHDKGNVINWILTTVRWKAIDQLRARNRRLNRDFRLDDDACADPKLNPESLCAESETHRRVSDAIRELSADQREAIESTYFAGLTQDEAAVVLGQPLGTIKSRIRSGLSLLRRSLTVRS